MIVINSILEVERYLDDIDAVIFDLDDTLYSEKEYVRSGYQKIADYLEKPELADQMWQVFENGGMAIDESLQANGLISRKEDALKIYRFQEPDIHLYSGVSELIQRLRTTKKVGIITDGRPEGQKAKIKALGLEVDEIIITDELGGVEFRKPNSAAFIVMKERMEVEFSRMIYIGDNINKDFIAPEKLGMKWILLYNDDSLYQNCNNVNIMTGIQSICEGDYNGR